MAEIIVLNRTEPYTDFLCDPYNTTAKFVTLQATGWLSVIVYSVILVMASFNMYYILVKQRYYKSMFLTLQYVFGALICVFRIVSTILVLTATIRLKNNICGNSILHVLNH
jgi:hypothetical protein